MATPTVASPARQRISQASAARLCLLRTRRPWVKLNDIISTAAPRSRIDHVIQSATSSRTGAGDGGGSSGGGCSGGVLVGSGVIDGADCCMCCMRHRLVAAQATHYHGDCRKRPRAQAENHAARLRACRHLQRGVQEHARIAWEDKHGCTFWSGYTVAIQGPSVSRSRRVRLQPRSTTCERRGRSIREAEQGKARPGQLDELCRTRGVHHRTSRCALLLTCFRMQTCMQKLPHGCTDPCRFRASIVVGHRRRHVADADRPRARGERGVR